MDRLIGCCGLDCGKCEARAATIANDDALRRKVAKEWGELNGMEFQPEWINCMGCRAEGCKTFYCSELCKIRRCAVSKGYATCGGCAERNVCEVLDELAQNAPEVMEFLEKMK